MKKKSFKEYEKHQKAKTIAKWVAVGVGWTALLGCFIGLLCLGLKGCNNKKSKSNEVAAVNNQDIELSTLGPLKKRNALQQSDLVNIDSNIASLFGKTYTVGDQYWYSGGNTYIYGLKAYNYQQAIGRFEVDIDTYDRWAGEISGFYFNNGSMVFGVYDVYSNVYEFDYRDLDYVEPTDYSLSLYNLTSDRYYQIGMSSLLQYQPSAFLTQFEYNFKMSSNDDIWYFDYDSTLNNTIELVLNRSYFQSSIVSNTKNLLVACSSPATNYKGSEEFDNTLYNGFYVEKTSHYSNDNYAVGNIYGMFPNTITYKVFDGVADGGWGQHNAEVNVVLKKSPKKTNGRDAQVLYYLYQVYFYDIDQSEDLMLFSSTSVDVSNPNDNYSAWLVNYNNPVFSQTTIQFSEINETPQTIISCQYDSGVADTYAYLVRPYNYNNGYGNNIKLSDYTKLIFNEDIFVGSPIVDGNVGDTWLNIFQLLKQAFQALVNIFNLPILPHITLGTLLFLPLVVLIVVFIVWLFKR